MSASDNHGSKGNQSAGLRSVFARHSEMQELRERLLSRRSFLLHGPAGVGKTLLISALLPEIPRVLYSPHNSTPQMLYRNLADGLLTAGYRQRFKSSSIAGKGARAIKGLVRDALCDSEYLVVLDHLAQPSQALAAAVRELKLSCSVSVIAVSRSDHMEDAGFVLRLFSDRKEKAALRNFDPDIATQFAAWCANKEGLQAGNISQFLERIVELSAGNPGAMVEMIRMAKSARYSHDGQIKVTPLYIDYRLATVAHT